MDAFLVPSIGNKEKEGKDTIKTIKETQDPYPKTPNPQCMSNYDMNNQSGSREHENMNNHWIHPFTGTTRNIPVIDIQVDDKKVSCTVDTGASRVMATTAMARKIWGNKFQDLLEPYPNKLIEDAQGNTVQTMGYITCTITLGEHLSVEYPIVIYKAYHQEILLGYAFLLDHNLNIYTGKGLGRLQTHETIKRLNYIEDPLECTPIEQETIPAKAIKAIKVKIWFPTHWTDNDRIAAIGSPIVIHSEDLEKHLDITQLSAIYTYDLIGIDHTANVVIDNSQNHENKVLFKNTVIAHAEFVHQEVPVEQIKRIIQDSSLSIGNQTQMGEYKLHPETQPGRYEYVDKINIKSDEPGTAEFCRKLLTDTEQFWSKNTFDMGRFDKKARMTLNTTTPIWDKYRPINPNKEAQAQDIVNQLEKHQIISRANSPYCSQPVWCWKKPRDKEGKQAIAGEADLEAPRALRLALDYRRINKIIASQCHFPNPGIKEMIFKLKSARYVSIMDLTNSYWHIELEESTKPILAFQTSTAQYIWNRLPQGTAPSMSIMAEAVQDTIYQGGIADCTTCYVDNIVVASGSLQDHKRDLRRTIDAFVQRGWKANPAKSHVFINTECRLFGFNINLQNQTIGPDPQKVRAIMDLPPPTNQKSARSICGSINYYSDIIPDLAPLMGPLHEITKDGKFEWTTECEQNFTEIKRKLAELPVVFMADFNQEMHLFTDAAQAQYIGYHISQFKHSLRKYVPVAWGSHKLNKHEQSMSQPEAELFAIVHAITQESLLLGFSKVIIHTDCKGLCYLFRFSKICSKLTRWQLILSSYDIEIYFEPSESIGILWADMLSRRPGKRITNRRPKVEEIEQLPRIDLGQKPNLTFHEAREEILKQLANLPPLSPEIIKHLHEKYTPMGCPPDQLECNKQIVNKLVADEEKIENFNTNYTHQFVYTPEQLAYRNDISPSGRLINFVLQEAPGLSLTTLRHHQLTDPYFGPLIKQMMQANKAMDGFAIKNGILLKESQDPVTEISYQICVPKSLSLQLIGRFHHSVFGAHPDLKKLMANLKKRFFIKNLKNECLEITKKCQICTLNKSFNNVRQPYGTKLKVTGPRQVYAMDICTVDSKAKEIDENLPTSFLIITDVWCLYTIAIPIQAEAKSKEILEKFSKHIIQPYGIPKIGITTDGAKNFSCNLSNTFSAVLGIQQFRISPYNARANPAERVNRAILAGLRYASQQYHLQPEVFKNLLNYIVLAWNTSVLSHINFSPYQLFLSTPYEPAALTSFVTIQEADKDYGDFISGLVKTQHIVENLVNKRYQESRDKRYQKQAEHAKHTVYGIGMQVMIKKKEDNTKRAHKLRPRYSGPYKIVKEYQNNVEVIPWMPDRKVQLIHKYKNEARNIPKFEKYMISKDRVKPCENLTFYYDEALARRFYQEFWDSVRDVQPIAEVERQAKPTEYLKNDPPHRPSSLIQPKDIGIKQIPPIRDQMVHQHGKSHQPTHMSTKTTHTLSTNGHHIPTADNNDIQNISENNSEVESAAGTDDDHSNNTSNGNDDDNDDNNDNGNDRTVNHQRVREPQIPQPPEQRPMVQPATHAVPQPRPPTEIGRHHLTGLPRPISPFRRGTTSPMGHRTPNHPTRRPISEIWTVTRPATAIGVEGYNNVLVFPHKGGEKVTRHIVTAPIPQDTLAQPGPSTSRGNVEYQRESDSHRAPSTRTTRSRMDPAVREALSSTNTLFQDREFDGLRNFHGQEVQSQIQNVSDILETNYQDIEDNIEEILQEEE